MKRALGRLFPSLDGRSAAHRGVARRSRAAGLLALAALLLPRLAAADAPDPTALVSRAQREMLQLDFERAIELLERAEATGANLREQLIVIYRSLGESHASVGQGPEAEAEFRRLLALDPDAQLPPGSSPKLTAPFAAARDFMLRRPALAIACERRGDDRAILSVQSDPLDLVAAARPVRADGSAVPGGARRPGRARVSLSFPPGAEACAALDRHGNELARALLVVGGARPPAPVASSGDDPTSILPPGEVAHRARPSRAPAPAPRPATIERDDGPAPPLYARWWLWGAGSAVAAGTAAYFAIQLQSDQDEWRNIKQASQEHTYREAVDIQERGERHALYSNIAFGASAALATVSIVLAVRASRARPEATAGVGAAPLPGRGGLATLWLTF
ncbi:MAG TPA: hypothetical protein VK698_04110 [Kofleriaceae bacterium]|nr:hypothetical protein [Kofleriaceae bacterium]